MDGVNPGEVTAILVTRGDVDLTAILNSLLPFRETIVYNNAEREDRACYGRFLAAQEAETDLVYTQDDDVLVAWPRLLQEWRGGDEILGSRPPGEPWRFLGVGALFPRSLVREPLDRYAAAYGADKDFDRVADVVFGYQRPYRPAWVGYAELEWQRSANRMYHQPGHIEVRQRAVDRITAQGWLVPEVVCPGGRARLAD